MVVQVTVVDGDAASQLMDRLRSDVGVDEVSFDPEHHLVRIGIANSPDGKLVEVLNLLESWLGATGLPPTEVEIDAHRYTLGATG
jgi:hypothetical protein